MQELYNIIQEISGAVVWVFNAIVWLVKGYFDQGFSQNFHILTGIVLGVPAVIFSLRFLLQRDFRIAALKGVAKFCINAIWVWCLWKFCSTIVWNSINEFYIKVFDQTPDGALGFSIATVVFGLYLVSYLRLAFIAVDTANYFIAKGQILNKTGKLV